jgi:hypothetical protein
VYGFILGNTARRIGTGDLQQERVWPPSKCVCAPPEEAPTLLEGELASDITDYCFKAHTVIN